ncbi:MULTISPECIES: NAD(P)-binding domain-containing protein [Streptomyces]|uniref:NAD(P)-binding domain-containing protein n=1 Tax=Streptomyces TaxID=1883 RepID=UPI000BEF75A1|nr:MULTISPECIES: NAD(P)-binding domain-containing protein [unclassified Streptomyces]
MGFIGAGPMGAPMVERLIAAGHDVVVSSRAPAALPPEWHTVSGPAAAADGADVICTVLPDSEEVRTAVGEVLTAAKPGAVVVETTSHFPQAARELVERAGSPGTPPPPPR